MKTFSRSKPKASLGPMQTTSTKHLAGGAPRVAEAMKPPAQRRPQPLQHLPKAQAHSSSLQITDPYAFIPSNYALNIAPALPLQPLMGAAALPKSQVQPKKVPLTTSKPKRTTSLLPLRRSNTRPTNSSPLRQRRAPALNPSATSIPAAGAPFFIFTASHPKQSEPAAQANLPQIYADVGPSYSDSDGEEDLFGHSNGVNVEELPFPGEESGREEGEELRENTRRPGKEEEEEEEEGDHGHNAEFEYSRRSHHDGIPKSQDTSDYVISGSDWSPSSDDEDQDMELTPEDEGERKRVIFKKGKGKKSNGAVEAAAAAKTGKLQLSSADVNKSAAVPSNIKPGKFSALHLAPAICPATVTGMVQSAEMHMPPHTATDTGTTQGGAKTTNPKHHKPRTTLSSQSALPVTIPARVVRDPQGTAVLMELPPGAELAGAAGVVGRITRGTEQAQHGNENNHGSANNITVDLMGVKYTTELIMLAGSAAVVHLTGGALVIDSLMTNAVRATAVPGQDYLAVEESMFGEGWDSDDGKLDGDGMGVGGKGRRKKGTAPKTKKARTAKKKSKPKPFRATKPAAAKKK